MESTKAYGKFGLHLLPKHHNIKTQCVFKTQAFTQENGQLQAPAA